MKVIVRKISASAAELSPDARTSADGVGISAIFGDQLVEILGDNDFASGRNVAYESVLTSQHYDLDPSWVHLVTQKGRLFNTEHPDVPVLFDRGRFQLVALDPERGVTLAGSDICFDIQPLPGGEVVFKQYQQPTARIQVPDWEVEIVGKVSADRILTTLESMTGYHSRHSLSDDFSRVTATLRVQFEDLGFNVTIEPIDIFNRTSGQLVGHSTNLVARKNGASPGPRGLVLVSAHLDSVNHTNTLDPTIEAPGADDNASGTAGVVELARVFEDHTGRDDLCLVLFGGEEQGLFGSTQFVRRMSDLERGRTKALINMDMVGVKNAEPATVLLEGAPISRFMLEGLSARASAHTDLLVRTSESPFASDHVPFIQAGLPAVLTIEGDDSQNGTIHTPDDLPADINPDYTASILRMNAGYVASLIGRAP